MPVSREAMLNWTDETPLIETNGWHKSTGSHATRAIWCGDICGFALGSGHILFADMNGTENLIQAHNGACLAAARFNNTIITSGDDGTVISTSRDGTQTTHFNQMGRFIDQLTTASWGAIAFADGRRIYVLMPEGKTREYRASGSVGGLAFSSKGRKLAASRNNGASVYWVGTERDTPDDYNWNGAHGLINWSPRGDFVVTSMHENALHVWRTDHQKHGRMGGYPTRIKSMSWDPKGTMLATSGADGIIIWPFDTKDGPIGKAAEQIPLKTDVIVSELSWHPKDNIIAVGTDQGDVLLVRRDGAIIPVILELGSAVTTLAWSDKGNALAFGTDSGEVGMITLS